MNHHITAGQWKEIVGNAPQYWGDLTADDLKKAQAGTKQLEGILQEKYGRTKKEAEKQVESFIKRFH